MRALMFGRIEGVEIEMQINLDFMAIDKIWLAFWDFLLVCCFNGRSFWELPLGCIIYKSNFVKILTVVILTLQFLGKFPLKYHQHMLLIKHTAALSLKRNAIIILNSPISSPPKAPTSSHKSRHIPKLNFQKEIQLHQQISFYNHF